MLSVAGWRAASLPSRRGGGGGVAVRVAVRRPLPLIPLWRRGRGLMARAGGGSGSSSDGGAVAEQPARQPEGGQPSEDAEEGASGTVKPLFNLDNLTTNEANARAFAAPLPVDGGPFASMPIGVFYVAMAALVAGAATIGANIGRSLPVDPDDEDTACYMTAGAFGIGAAAVAYQAKRKRDGVAIVELYNQIVELDEPHHLTADAVQGVASQFGISLQKDQLDGMQRIYGQYLESVVPKGETQLQGHEGERVRAFKEALGLSDEQAAPVHVELARKFHTQGFELNRKDRVKENEFRKAFSRLIYISQLVFGEQGVATHLQWTSNLPVGEAALFVARRDNAKAAFRALFEAGGGVLKADREALVALKQLQERVRLIDESAEEVVKDYQSKIADAHVAKALAASKLISRGDGLETMHHEVDSLLQFSADMDELADDEDVIVGVGGVKVSKPAASADAAARDAQSLYTAWLEARAAAAGGIGGELTAEAKRLQAILDIPDKTEHTLRNEVAVKLYRQALKEEIMSKRIDAAASPAAVLQGLCEKYALDGEVALDLHSRLFRAKLVRLAAKGVLSADDQKELARVRRVLCIPKDSANKVVQDVCGKYLADVIGEIYSKGIHSVSEAEVSRVSKKMEELGLEKDIGVAVLSTVTRDKFRSYIKEVQNSGQDRQAAATHLKHMVQFNAIVVTPVLEGIKGTSKAMKDIAEMMKKAAEDAKKKEAAAAKKDAPKAGKEAPAEKAAEVRSGAEAKPDDEDPEMKKLEEMLKKAAEGAKKDSGESDGAGADSTAGATSTPEAAAEAVKDGEAEDPEMRKLEEILKKAAEGAKKDAAPEDASGAKQEGDSGGEDDDKAKAMKEIEELMAQAKADAKKEEAGEGGDKEQDEQQGGNKAAEAKSEPPPKVTEVQKAIQVSRGEFGEAEKKGQKEITLKEDLDSEKRGELYKAFMLQAMSGDVVDVPLAGVNRRKNNAGQQEQIMARLTQLADLLGMDQMETMTAQQGLAETAYKNQVEQVMSQGPLTRQSLEYLEGLQKQIGLNPTKGADIIKEKRKEMYGVSPDMPLDGERWSMEKIKDLKAKGEGEVEKVDQTVRKNLFRRELERRLSDGTGELDSDTALVSLPSTLALPDSAVKNVVKELVEYRRRTLLVQAVSSRRQSRPDDTLAALQNLVSCRGAMPDQDPLKWEDSAELRDLYIEFCTKEGDPRKRLTLRSELGLADEPDLGAAVKADAAASEPELKDFF